MTFFAIIQSGSYGDPAPLAWTQTEETHGPFRDTCKSSYKIESSKKSEIQQKKAWVS